MLAQLADQRRVLRELLHQNLAGALERRFRIGDARILALLRGERRLEVLGRLRLRIE